MTETYIIWRFNIWIKYILINNWQFTIRRYVNIDKDKIQRKLKVHDILLDIYYYNQIYYWSKNENQDCRKMCYVTFVSVLPVLIEESRGPKHNWPILPKALHPSSFHCCQPQDPSHVFVLPSLLALCARLGARPLVFVCPRKLLKERATYQGVTRPAWELSLSYLSHFS